jgi:hypothetical protein
MENEIDDQLARIGSEHPFIRSQLACDISKGVVQMPVTDMNINHKKLWQSTAQSHKGLSSRTICRRINQKVLGLNRNQLTSEMVYFPCSYLSHSGTLKFPEHLICYCSI